MCTVSDHIKFCSCADVDDIEALANYWILHQFHEHDEEITIGMCMPPTAYNDPHLQLNVKVILNRLNEGKAFDKPLEFAKKDRLQVTLTLDAKRGSYSYFFEFNGRKWKVVKEDVFELMSAYRTYRQGAICQAMTL